MKILAYFASIILSVAAAADSVSYSSTSGILSISQALEDEVIAYRDINIQLNVNTEKFVVLDSIGVQPWLFEPFNLATFSNQTQTLTIPFVNFDHENFYRDVQILLNFATGMFTIVGGIEISTPSSPFVISSKAEDRVHMYNGQQIEIYHRITDTRCPASSICGDPGEVTMSVINLENTVGGSAHHFTLPGIGGGSGETTTVGDFEVTILDVLPYPETADHDISIEDYEFVLMYEYIGGQ